jgi:AhpC/TSA family
MHMATVINDTAHVEVDATLGDRWLMQPDAFEALTGWTLKPEGMCRGDVCAPIYKRDAVIHDGMVDLLGAAPLIGRSAIVDTERGIAALGASATARAEEMTTLHAPDFTVDDMNGNPVSLRDFAGRKVLLLAWSSW